MVIYNNIKEDTEINVKLGELMKFATEWYPDKKFKHALRVACYASDDALTRTNISSTEAFLVGLAHDLIEDTECPQEILNYILGPELFTVVLILTKLDNETYNEYIQRVIHSDNDLAIHVKRADMKDHMAQTDTLTDKLKEKYLPVLHYFL